ncbi:MAG: 3'-5' exonuclease, partial [Verrucomicrobiales bacterium]
YLFLRHIKQEQDASEDAEPAAGETTDAVRLISVHQSKGLEFPIVVIPDLAKRFNLQDLNSGLILDEQYGLCSYIKADTTGSLYPSLPYWLAQRRERKEILAEEMRVLYVALTRAQSKLILVASATANQTNKWLEKAIASPSLHQLLQANSWLDWIAPCLTAETPKWIEETVSSANWASKVIDSGKLSKRGKADNGLARVELSEESKAALLEKFAFTYPHDAATRQQAKSTVTRLRRGLEEASTEESKVSHFARPEWPGTARKSNKAGTEIGKAYHTVLEHTPIEALSDEKQVRQCIGKLTEIGILTEDQASHIQPEKLTEFWQSDIGGEIQKNAPYIKRELPFTARFTCADLKAFEPASDALVALPDDEFIIVQGAVDLAVILPREIWLIDFKSDYVAEGEEITKVEQYTPQLNLYALALEKVYNRPVSRKWLRLLIPGKTFEVGARPQSPDHQGRV